MRSQQTIIRSNRACGAFFIFLAAVSLPLACFGFYSGHWVNASFLLIGIPFCGFIGWLAITGMVRFPRAGGTSGTSQAGKPVPVAPAPRHHLVAAKDLPPSERTHSLAKD
jgi:hypothetical protein